MHLGARPLPQQSYYVSVLNPPLVDGKFPFVYPHFPSLNLF